MTNGNLKVKNCDFGDIFINSVAVNANLAVFETINVDILVQNSVFRDINVLIFSVSDANFVLFSEVTMRNIDGNNSISAGLYCQNCFSVSISQSNFTNMHGTTASGLLLMQKDSHKLGESALNQVSFRDMWSGNYGAVAVMDSSMSISEVYVGNSSANGENSCGGAVYFSCDCVGNVTNSVFEGNTARSGGGIYWDKAVVRVSSCVFERNWAEFGLNVASKPVSLVSAEERIEGVASGQTHAGEVEVLVVDYYTQSWVVDNSSEAWLGSKQDNVTLQGSTKAKAVEGIYRFSGFVVLADPGSTVELQVTSTALDSDYSASLHNSSHLLISVSLRLCVTGEIQRGLACSVCSADTYSLSVKASECKACPAAATCKGGRTLYPHTGYWRPAEDSELILACPRAASCLGNANYTSETGLCAGGYHGNLCQVCDAGYSRSERDACTKCPDPFLNSLRLSFVSLGVIGFLLYTIRSAFQSAAKELNMQGVYMKILMNYLQSVVLTASFSMNWPLLVMEMFKAQSYAGEANEQILSFECFSQESNYPFSYQKIILVAVLPIALLVFPALYWLLHIRKTAFVVLRDKYITSVTILLFAMYPLVTRTSFAAFNCRLIQPGEWWLRDNLSLRCWDAEHLRVALGAALPAILLWGVGIPLGAGLLLKRQRRRLKTPVVKAQFGFLFLGFQEKCYYWEFIVLIRKVSLVAVYVFLSAASPAVQGLLVFSLLSISLGLQLKYSPYMTAELNALELRNILVSEATIYCGLFFLSQDLPYATEMVLFLIMLVTNTYFVLYWSFCYCQVLLIPMAKKSPEAVLRWCRCLPLINRAALKALKRTEEEHAPILTNSAYLANIDCMTDLYMNKVHQELQRRGAVSTQQDDAPPSTPIASVHNEF